jgi:hypothetical protein
MHAGWLKPSPWYYTVDHPQPDHLTKDQHLDNLRKHPSHGSRTNPESQILNLRQRKNDVCEPSKHLEVRKNSIRVLILYGSGDQAFVAGAEIAEMESLQEASIRRVIILLLCRYVRATNKNPIIGGTKR